MSILTTFINEIQTNPASLSSILAVIGLALLLAAISVIKKVKFTTKLLTNIALMVALATVLNMFTLYKLPYGGSVTPGSMVPILLLAIIIGPEVGFITGFIYGIISLIMDPVILHPVQVLFDYPLAFMALGLAGYVKKSKKLQLIFAPKNKGDKIINVIAIVVAILGRFLCSFISGVVFFSNYTPEGMSVVLYSIIYNGSYLGLDAIICIAIILILPVNRIKKQIKGM